MAGGISQFLYFGYVTLGAIGDALNIALSLESTSWLLLGIVVGLNAIIGQTHVVVAKHLLGIEAKSRKE